MTNEGWWCLTCGYGTDTKNLDKRNEEHLRHDGAHEPNWQEE